MRALALRTQLTLFFTAALALLAATLGVTYYQVLARQLDRDATAMLEQLTSGLHGYLKFTAAGPSLAYDRDDPEEAAFVEGATRYYQVFDAATGELVAQSSALAPLGLHYTPAEVHAFLAAPGAHDMQTDRGRLRLSSSTLAPPGGRTYLLQVGVPLDAVDDAMARFVRILLWSVPAALVLALLIGRWMAFRALAPLVRMAAASRRIDVGDLGQRLPLRGAADELDEVAQAFNDTLARVERSVAEMRQFSAAIAHELRTPLAALRGRTELALTRATSVDDCQRVFGDQLEELDTLARLITRLLTLARAEAGEIPLACVPVDLAALAGVIVEQVEPVAQAKEVGLRAEGDEPVVVSGDPGWLERLMLNLLDNAIKFTQPRGLIVVRVRRDGDEAVLVVEDNGIGIPPEALPHLFERFFRADAARSSALEGVGLGLSLVRWIADRHGARLSVDSQAGTGSRFSVRMPLYGTPGKLKQH